MNPSPPQAAGYPVANGTSSFGGFHLRPNERSIPAAEITNMKLKSRKSILKRFKITGKKKLLHRPISQDHFNAKSSGKRTMGKRRLKSVAAIDVKTLKKQIPYHV
jgi:ribosomal protein L35